MAQHKPIPRPTIKWPLVPSGEIGQQLGVSRSTLRRWRVTNLIREGIHWQYQPGTKARILWNLELMRDFVVNEGTPAHNKSIERYVASLVSSRTT